MYEAVSGVLWCIFDFLDVGGTLLLTAVLLAVSYWYLSVPRGLPPGPPGLPVVGYLPFVGRLPHLKFDKMAKKYGPVFSVYLGNRLVLVLNSYEAIKEAFVNQAEAFAGRPQLNFSMASRHKYSVLGTDGEVWKDQHRFILKLLKDLGMGKMSIEPQITDEIQHFLSELEALGGAATDFSPLLMRSVLNNINILIFGRRFDYYDRWLVESTKVLTELMTAAESVSGLLLFPWLTKIPGIAKLLSHDDLMSRRTEILKHIGQTLYERKKNYTDVKRDNIINAFIGEQKSREASHQGFPFPDEALEENVITLMGGGMDTTSGYLSWIFLYMAAYPEVQATVQKEIDDVIGLQRAPCYSDRLLTRYTEATILEVQRMETLGPSGIAHRCTKDSELMGYRIPKDTIVISNMWAVNNDRDLWQDPDSFRPERFLVPNGPYDKKEHVIPFSMGKRECIGKGLAKMELYLYFTSMLQKFNIASEDGSKPNLERVHGMVVKPKYFKPRAVLRTPK